MFESIEACQQCEPIGPPGHSYCRDCGLRATSTRPTRPIRTRTTRADVTQLVRSRVQRLTARAVTARLRHPTGDRTRRPSRPGLA
jgi:hypothetical protein